MIQNNVYTQPLVIRPKDQGLEVQVVMEYDHNFLQDRMVATVYLFGQRTGFTSRAIVPEDWFVGNRTGWDIRVRNLAQGAADLAMQTFIRGMAGVSQIPEQAAQIETLGRDRDALSRRIEELDDFISRVEAVALLDHAQLEELGRRRWWQFWKRRTDRTGPEA